MSAVELVNVAKKYRVHGRRPRSTTLMSYVLRDVWRRRSEPAEHLWALRDVSLTVERGSTVGIIGRNGSGKSTLLKLISGVHKPDLGRITVRGSVAALIELGAGFHPDLTGRENILINGIILGLTRDQIRARFDDIVRFAELTEYIDEPVRTYSSGMYLRLGFAVAAHVDPDVLLLDEVFAVGDAAFSTKCVRRIDEFKAQGKTIILVTHTLEMVRSWCDQAVWLQNGMIRICGDPGTVVDAYLGSIRDLS